MADKDQVKDVTQDIPDNVSKEEQIGIHKGALSTLANERKELSRLVDITEQLMQMHIKALKELGVDLEAQAQQAQGGQAGQSGQAKTDKKIDDLL
ncbi:MAG: hypothetical protein ACQESG_03260 [Nanobdellota archaeon]